MQHGRRGREWNGRVKGMEWKRMMNRNWEYEMGRRERETERNVRNGTEEGIETGKEAEWG